MEVYVNSMFLGNGSYGVEAASRRYFNKPIEQASPAEHALIAGLFQSPSRFNPVKYPKRAKRRQIKVVKNMYRAGIVSKGVARDLIQYPLVYQSDTSLNRTKAPYFVDYIKKQAEEFLTDSKVTKINSEI